MYGEYHLIPLAEILRPLANQAHTLGSPQFTGHAHHGTCCYLSVVLLRGTCVSQVTDILLDIEIKFSTREEDFSEKTGSELKFESSVVVSSNNKH